MKLTEKRLVEDYIIEKFDDTGWKFIPAEDLERESLEEPLLQSNLVRSIEKLNKDLGITEEEIKAVLNELKFAASGIEGAKKILNFYKFGVPVKFEKDRVVKFIQLFNHSDFSKNEYIVSRQIHFQGKERIIPDIILFMNGIPLVNIECKNPATIGESWINAYEQIKDYEKIVPELYKYVQFGVAAEAIAHYFPIVPWADDVRTSEWRTPELDSIDSVLDMLNPANFTNILRNFFFLRVEMGSATKVITRYMQYRAANKMTDRVIRNLSGKEDKNRGLIWHWQGSGKTLTMIFAAHKLYFEKSLENPSVFFIVDRVELEGQLSEEFNALEIVKPEIIGSIPALKRILKYDDYRGKRGLFILLIHKFRPEEILSVQKELEEVSQSKETIMTRRNVIAFVDEGHRTQYGLLAAQMKAVFKSAFFFAMTGTPIAKKGRDTYSEFSYPPEEDYLDRYFITDSIKDKFTVRIAYQPRLEKDVHLKKELLDDFLSSEFEEIPNKYQEYVKKEVQKRLNAVNLFLEDPKRIAMIAADIAQHFKENLDGRFKALVVAGSQEACAIYKLEIDRHLPSNYSDVVLAYQKKDRRRREHLEHYVAEARARYGLRDFQDIRKDFIDKYKEEEHPNILIVTDMLLIGFDVPALQTMYLDKPLKEHRLLQAVARTNRPYKGIKEAGMIIDYVGILKEFKRALAMYSRDDIQGAILDIKALEEEFLQKLKDTLVLFLEVPQDFSRDSLYRAFEVISSDKQVEVTFQSNYKAIRKLFELLGSAEVKLEFLTQYKWLSAVYTYYQKLARQGSVEDNLVRKYLRKTIQFAHQSTEIKELEKDLPVFVFDEHYLGKLEKKVKSREEKAANILFTLNRFVLVDRHKNPVFESIADKVERLLRLWKEKKKNYELIFTKGTEAMRDMHKMLARQKALDFSHMEYAVLIELEKKFPEAKELVNQIKDFSLKINPSLFSGWIHQVTAKKEVEREVRRFVRGLKSKYKLSFEEMNKLHNALVECIKNYGT